MEEQGGEATVLNPPGAWKNVSKISSGGFSHKISLKNSKKFIKNQENQEKFPKKF